MPTYEKRAKRGKNGAVVRYIGQNIKGLPEKFRLGYDHAYVPFRIIQKPYARFETLNVFVLVYRHQFETVPLEISSRRSGVRTCKAPLASIPSHSPTMVP